MSKIYIMSNPLAIDNRMLINMIVSSLSLRLIEFKTCVTSPEVESVNKLVVTL